MALSEHELRVWHELERELSGWRRLPTAVRLYWLAVVVGVVATAGIVLTAMYAPAAVAAPVAAICGAGFAYELSLLKRAV
jgi:hypothetical protein